MTSSTAITNVVVDGRHIRVRVDGDEDQPPILLLHGVGRSLEDWSPQFDRLAGYRTIAPDLPGSGFSARPAGPMSLQAQAHGAAGALDALGERRPVHVLGHSLGGAVALQLLALRPERVGSLVLVSSGGFGSEVTWLLRMLVIPGIGGYLTRHTTRASARMFERAIYADPSVATKERIDHALRIAAQPGFGPGLHELARGLGTVRGVRREWREELLAEVVKHPRPTLIIWGDRDRFLPPHHLDAAKRVLPHAQTHLFAGVGHAPQVERPDEFAALVTAFISSVPAEPRKGAASERQ